MRATLRPDGAILIVDAQKDFFPGGALAVPEGDEIIEPLNRWIEAGREAGAKFYASRDWHPPDHCSFKEQGGPWPPHCLKESEGAKFHPDIDFPPDTRIVTKGDEKDQEAYSAFLGTNLAQRLHDEGVKVLWVGGLAQDICVKHTVLDAVEAGFEVHVIVPATSAVNIEPGDGEAALEEMRSAGAFLESSETGDSAYPYDAQRVADL